MKWPKALEAMVNEMIAKSRNPPFQVEGDPPVVYRGKIRGTAPFLMTAMGMS